MVHQIVLSTLYWLLEKQCIVLTGKSNFNDKLKTSAELNISLNTAQLEKQIIWFQNTVFNPFQDMEFLEMIILEVKEKNVTKIILYPNIGLYLNDIPTVVAFYLTLLYGTGWLSDY